MVEPTGRWLTNKHSSDLDDFLSWCTLRTRIGPPQATDAYSVRELVEMGMVGVYEVSSESPRGP